MIENTKGACEPEMLGVSILKREEQKRRKEDYASIVFKLNGLLSGPERKVWILTGTRGFEEPSWSRVVKAYLEEDHGWKDRWEDDLKSWDHRKYK